MSKESKVITEEDIDACWPLHHKSYLAEILNGEYSVESAKEDLMSLIGSKYDTRPRSVESDE